jgi:hypothetical protein
MTASSKFLEKQIAYLFISLLCGDESMLRLIVHSLRLDLCSEDNEVVCLGISSFYTHQVNVKREISNV